MKIKLHKKRLLLAVALCGIIGCQPHPKIIAIDMYGDSTMAACAVSPGAKPQVGCPANYEASPNSSFAYLRRMLTEKFGSQVVVTNLGVGGARLIQVIDGDSEMHGLEIPYAKRLAQSDARIVVENFGINDYGKDLAIFERSLIAFIDETRAAGKIPVVEEPNPIGAPPFDGALDHIVALIDQICAERNVTVIPQYRPIKALPEWHSLLADGIHPGDALYKIKGEEEFSVLGPIVQAALSNRQSVVASIEPPPTVDRLYTHPIANHQQ